MKFDKTLIPDEIVTLEQLAGWVIAALSRPSISMRYREVENRREERIVESRFLASGENDFRFVFRGGLKVDPKYLSVPPFYLQIQESFPDPILTPDPIPTPDPTLMVNGSAWSAFFEDGFYTVLRPLSVMGPIESGSLINNIKAALRQKYGLELVYDSYFVSENGIFYSFNLP